MEAMNRYDVPDRRLDGEAWQIEREDPNGIHGTRLHGTEVSFETTPVAGAEDEETNDGRPTIPLEGTILIGGFPRAIDHRS